VRRKTPIAASVACRGKATRSVTPSTAPMSENGVNSTSSDLSASREKRAPRVSAADTSSSTDSGSTKSSGNMCERIGTVKSAAPNAEMPNTT
jgi:hypothetical protein